MLGREKSIRFFHHNCFFSLSSELTLPINRSCCFFCRAFNFYLFRDVTDIFAPEKKFFSYREQENILTLELLLNKDVLFLETEPNSQLKVHSLRNRLLAFGVWTISSSMIIGLFNGPLFVTQNEKQVKKGLLHCQFSSDIKSDRDGQNSTARIALTLDGNRLKKIFQTYPASVNQ